MNGQAKLNTLRIALVSAALLSSLTLAPDAQSKPHHHQVRHEETSEEPGPAAQPEQAQAGEAPASTEEGQTGQGEGARHAAPRPVVSLFDIVGQGLGFGLLIIILLAVPLSSTVLLCAIVWHTQKALNGGKKPSIG